MIERTDDLTIEQLERIIANHESGVQPTGVNVYRQLLATMRREERLRAAIEETWQAYTDYKGDTRSARELAFAMGKLWRTAEYSKGDRSDHSGQQPPDSGEEPA
jgi:hypothetical protein